MEAPSTYRQAGVDTRAAAQLVDEIRPHIARTQKARSLMGAFGLFAAAYDLSDYEQPVLVTGCDGVGTKLAPLLEQGREDIAGRDLVAMSVNDILTTGGDPLLFLDYIGLAQLDGPRIKKLIAGMCDALEECGCILAGGETAEMPGLVEPGVIELSGFCIGAVEKSQMIDPSRIEVGDVVVGYRSAGFHANGWSLVRRILEKQQGEWSASQIEELLAPTRLYHTVTRGLSEAGVAVKGYAHITGGGLPENLERILPGVGARLTVPRWEAPGVQRILKDCDPSDWPHTFNLGIGWVAVVAPVDVEAALAVEEGACVLGEVSPREGVEVEVAS